MTLEGNAREVRSASRSAGAGRSTGRSAGGEGHSSSGSAGGDGHSTSGDAGGGGHSTGVLRARTHARVRAPRSLASALEDLAADLAPASVLGRVQTVWERATGATIAASASPVAEREGVLTVLCESSVWAQELEMLSPDVIESLNSALRCEAIVKLRCRTA
ncbi:MAG TPA: DUF721 domain-containing protein [Solirubrobacteraceae bacterium]|nr:DUF721 domain-containing protein [Solirubrobacteraceae bacterium]